MFNHIARSMLPLCVFPTDWAGDVNDHTSISTYLVFLGATPISWSSKKPRTIAHSSTKAEYRSVTSSAVEINRIQNLLSKLHLSSHTVPPIYCDNVGATYLCANPVFHSRMKHMLSTFTLSMIKLPGTSFVSLIFTLQINLLIH